VKLSTKERGGKPNKTPSLKEPSLAITPHDGGNLQEKNLLHKMSSSLEEK
jgi:hypothetical protein